MIDSVLARGKLRQLIATIEQEKTVLLNGPLNDLAKHAARRDKLFDSLMSSGAVSQKILSDKLPEIRALATRNSELLKSAIEGMKDARKAVENMKENLNRLDTYSRDGVKTLVAPPLPGTGRRV